MKQFSLGTDFKPSSENSQDSGGFSWGTETGCLRTRLKDNLNKKDLMKTGIIKKRRDFCVKFPQQTKEKYLVILKSIVFLITKISGKP